MARLWRDLSSSPTSPRLLRGSAPRNDEKEVSLRSFFSYVIASRRRGNPGGGVFLEIAKLVASPSVHPSPFGESFTCEG